MYNHRHAPETQLVEPRMVISLVCRHVAWKITMNKTTNNAWDKVSHGRRVKISLCSNSKRFRLDLIIALVFGSWQADVLNQSNKGNSSLFLIQSGKPSPLLEPHSVRSGEVLRTLNSREANNREFRRENSRSLGDRNQPQQYHSTQAVEVIVKVDY